LSPYVVSIRSATALFPIVAVLLLLPIGLIHYRRFGYVSPRRALAFYAFVFYLLCAFFLTLLPLPELTADFCLRHARAAHPQLIPFASVREIFVNAEGVGLPARLIQRGPALQVFFNFLLLLPLGFFLRYLYGASARTVVAVAFATSILFEVTQLSAVFGLYPCPYRLFDIDDLWLNTSGALVGFLLAGRLPFLPRLERLEPDGVEFSLYPRAVAIGFDLAAVYLTTLLVSELFAFGHGGTEARLVRDLILVVWFLVIPFVTGGYTAGKKFVHLRIVPLEGGLEVLQLTVRYLLLIGVPVVIGRVIGWLIVPGPGGLVDGGRAAIALTLFCLEVIAFPGLVLIRSDRRGLHEIVSRTRQTHTM